MNGLTKNDSEQIGFATACLFAEALNIDELHQWILLILESQADTPPYLLELLEFSGPLFKIYKIIGFVPSWPGTQDEKLALFGIAYKRGREPFQCPLTREQALAKLEEFPNVRAVFSKMFSFIVL
jgi:hypothetical protein